jgi:UDP-2-acetamido-2,6-beta-L-arabino-hexul-4-ose reductase
MKIAITGEKGFLGTHLTNYFKNNSEFEVITLGRNYLVNTDKIKEADYLIHAASIHRNPDPEVVYLHNMEIHKQLVSFLSNNHLKINVIFISSIQEYLDNPYGRSKAEGKRLFEDYCEKVGSEFISHSVPNLFGPGAKPNHTSFIATFCYNIHNNIPCHYNTNEVKLCFVEDAVKVIAKLKKASFSTTKMTVRDVYYLLLGFKEQLSLNITPRVRSDFEKNLLQTFLSYRIIK